MPLRPEEASISYLLQELASSIDAVLREASGAPAAFVLVIQSGQVAQYVSNSTRKDGMELIQSLLSRWEKNEADIPAHYNPDLTRELKHVSPHPYLEAAVAWEVCASIHREFAKGRDGVFTTRQADFIRHAEEARAMHARLNPEPPPPPDGHDLRDY